jgi:CelD/BcsL family acetyltransferase involved in cellulose biosynthesis
VIARVFRTEFWLLAAGVVGCAEARKKGAIDVTVVAALDMNPADMAAWRTLQGQSPVGAPIEWGATLA